MNDDDYEEDDPDADCPTCRGDGYLFPGEDFPERDIDWFDNGVSKKCHDCRGSGKEKDCWWFKGERATR